MKTIHMMIGIQGSGKSTYSKELSKYLGIPILSSDELRNEHPTYDNKMIFSTLYDLCKDILVKGGDLIFDATSITKEVRGFVFKEMEQRGLKRSDYKVKAYYFLPNLELAKKRVEVRNKDPKERFLPIDVIEMYLNKLEPPTLNEGFESIKEINPVFNKEDIYKGEK